MVYCVAHNQRSYLFWFKTFTWIQHKLGLDFNIRVLFWTRDSFDLKIYQLTENEFFSISHKLLIIRHSFAFKYHKKFNVKYAFKL